MLARDRYDWCGISASVAVLRQALAEAAAGCDAPRLCRLPGFATYLRCASESERLSPCVARMCHAACICLDERARLRTSPLFAGSGVDRALAGGDRRSRHGSAASRQRALDRVMFMPFVFVVAPLDAVQGRRSVAGLLRHTRDNTDTAHSHALQMCALCGAIDRV